MAEIAIRNVRKSFGKDQVIHGVDLAIRDGEFVVILGPSGCGKSTLLRMIAGLETVTAGEIAIGGTVVNEMEPRERGCAMVFQNYALYPHMSVADNIGYALKVAGVKKAERMERVRTVARTIGLEEFLDRKPAQLSGGQRQRVAMGRAMIREPKVFLFDEPLSNLDAKLRVQMRIEIRRLHQRLSATSIFVTHDQIEAMTLADRIIVMRAGHVEQVGTPSEIYDAPATHFVGEFIGSPPMSFLPARVEGPGMLACGGGHLAFDPARFDAAPGMAVNVGLRAEHMDVTPGRGRGIPAVFEFFEELGSARLLHARAGDAALVVQTGRALALDPGAPVSVAVAPEHVHLYDPASGRRLAPARAMAEAAE